MSAYTIHYKQSAEKEVKRLPAKVVLRIRAAINDLANDPRPHGCIMLKDYDHIYRIRVGTYRVLYEIHDDLVVIMIIQITHRKDAYR